jgi:hypothetical protein
VDLKSLYEWTRGQLEAEAEKRGIKGFSSLTRLELIRALMAQGLTAGQQAVRMAQNALSSALSAAVIRFPRQLEALKNLSRRLPASGQASRPRAFSQTANDSFKTVRLEVTAPINNSGDEVNPTVAPTARTFIEEPIRTRSMARLLAAQGHRDRACAIYDELLEKIPSDAQLQSEAESVRRGQPVGFENAERIRRAANAEPIVLPECADLVRCEGGADEALTVRWTITEQGKERAAAVLGRGGELAVRIMAVVPDPELVVRSEVTEYGPVESSGSWTARALPRGARCFTAVGLRANNRFVAIIHAPARTIGVSTEAPPALLPIASEAP